jgi:hypothetical protein
MPPLIGHQALLCAILERRSLRLERPWCAWSATSRVFLFPETVAAPGKLCPDLDRDGTCRQSPTRPNASLQRRTFSGVDTRLNGHFSRGLCAGARQSSLCQEQRELDAMEESDTAFERFCRRSPHARNCGLGGDGSRYVGGTSRRTLADVVSWITDHGETWSEGLLISRQHVGSRLIDEDGFGAPSDDDQSSITADSAGTILAVWTVWGRAPDGPARIWLATMKWQNPADTGSEPHVTTRAGP